MVVVVVSQGLVLSLRFTFGPELVKKHSVNNCKYSLGYFFWSCKISFIICDCSYLPLIGCILNQFMIAIFLILQNSTLFSFYWICCTFHNNKPILGLSTTFNWTDFVHSLRNPCLLSDQSTFSEQTNKPSSNFSLLFSESGNSISLSEPNGTSPLYLPNPQ